MKLRINSLFNDHMVLQRHTHVPVWGEGIDGSQVFVSCGENQVSTVVVEGHWKVELPPMDAGGPYEMIVSSDGDRIVLRDVLFGEVWLAGGQSNMQWSLKDSTNADQEISVASLPKLRFYDVPRISYDDGLEHAGSWEVCTPEQAGDWSAVGYYYAKQLVGALDVPIGIIGCNWGGTSAACWVPEEVLINDSELRVYVDEYKETLSKLDPDTIEMQEKQFHAAVEEFNRRLSAGLEGQELGEHPWPPPLNEKSFLRPNGLYSTMLRRVVPYAIAGFIYYQGESDAHRPLMYDRLLATLIHKWRTDWGSETLPFLLVQLPGYAYDGDPDGAAWPLLRESQLRVTQQVPHTAMAVTLDCGEKDDIHPLNKKPVGERLALLALKEVYGLDVVSSGPVLQQMQVEGKRVKLQFDCAGAGLATREGAVIGFELAGDDGQYAAAKANISGDIVEVWSEDIEAPMSVRYAWANFPNANIVNSHGLPAGPFRAHVDASVTLR